MNNYNDYYSYMNNYIPNPSDVMLTRELPYNTYQNMSNMNYPVNSAFNTTFMQPTLNNELLDPKEGLEKGNLFKNLYDQYKNYKVQTLQPKTERQKKLNDILAYAFAMNDLALYLDNYPNNSSYINLYNEYRKIKNNLENEYEKMYGPIDLNSSALESNTWLWKNMPWPWEGEL